MTPSPSERRAHGIAVRQARLARVSAIRRRAVASALALFVATWLLITMLLVTGHDPALARPKSKSTASGSAATTSTATPATTTTAATTATQTTTAATATPTSTTATASPTAASSASSGTSSSSSPSALTSSQS